MKMTRFAAILFLMLSAAISAHQSVSVKTQSAIVNTSDKLNGSNKIEKFDLFVQAGADKHSLSKHIQLKSGQIRLRLYSPDNKLFSETVYSSTTTDNFNQSLPLVIGKWRLEIEALDAYGKYDIEWVSSTD